MSGQPRRCPLPWCRIPLPEGGSDAYCWKHHDMTKCRHDELTFSVDLLDSWRSLNPMQDREEDEP